MGYDPPGWIHTGTSQRSGFNHSFVTVKSASYFFFCCSKMYRGYTQVVRSLKMHWLIKALSCASRFSHFLHRLASCTKKSSWTQGTNTQHVRNKSNIFCDFNHLLHQSDIKSYLWGTLYMLKHVRNKSYIFCDYNNGLHQSDVKSLWVSGTAANNN